MLRAVPLRELRQQALREVQADCDALRQRAGAKMPQAVDTILRRVVQE